MAAGTGSERWLADVQLGFVKRPNWEVIMTE
jgi:hypothetical protein